MRRIATIAAALLTLSTVLAAPPARAQSGEAVKNAFQNVGNQVVNPESHVWTKNDSDTWVWITVYNPVKISGSWCVAPHTLDKHGLKTTLLKVRAEVTHSGCRHPVILDKTLVFNTYGPTKPGMYVLTGANGKYEFTKG
jgi:hypothetical protein